MGSWPCTLVLLATTILFTLPPVIVQARGTYGEQCSSTNRCDSRAFLICTNGTCECTISDHMSFDGTKCVVFAGEKCTYTAVDIQSRGEERTWREELPCVTNSWCQDGFCSCLPEYYESANGTCITKRGYQEECEFNLACKTDQLLICSDDKKCECNSTVSTYDAFHQRCVAVAGASCENGLECVSNAKCALKYRFSFYSGTSRQEEIHECKCDSNYFVNSKRECEAKRGYKEACEENDQCQYQGDDKLLGLVCNTEGHCGCSTDDETVFDISTMVCVTLAGKSCRGFSNCVTNSECSRDPKSRQKLCTCISDQFQTSTGTCERKREHGKPCQNDDYCSKDLKCSFNGICECDKTKKAYDSSKRKCVGLADSSCSNRENERDCIPNASCYNEYNDGHCKCNNGFTKSQNGSCLASHGSSCGIDWTSACNAEQGTICKDGICKCKYEFYQEFQSGEEKCVSKVEGPCDESTDCVLNSHCSQEEETFRQCVCDTGFIMVEGFA